MYLPHGVLRSKDVNILKALRKVFCIEKGLSVF